MGIPKGLAVDIDPCARTEAKANIALNKLDDRIAVCRRLSDVTNHTFVLLTANLRYPSLKMMAAQLTAQAADDGVLVLSGIKLEEIEKLIAVYAKQHFICEWKKTEQEWAAIVLKKQKGQR